MGGGGRVNTCIILDTDSITNFGISRVIPNVIATYCEFLGHGLKSICNACVSIFPMQGPKVLTLHVRRTFQRLRLQRGIDMQMMTGT
jgi:hypothetical protein